MNSRIIFWSVFLGLLIWGCSNDDSAEQEQENEQSIPDFQCIGEDFENIFLYNYDSDMESGSAANLTQENDLDRFYIGLKQVSEVLSFFSFFEGDFSLLQKNVQNNSVSTFENFISESSERSVIWGANTESEILIGYYSPRGSGEFGVRVLDAVTEAFVDTPLASNVFDTQEPLYFNQRLFASYLDNNDRYHLVVFNTVDFSIVTSFDFLDETPSFLIDDMGNFVLFLGNQGVFKKEVYSIANMDLLESDSFIINEFFQPGPMNAYLVEDKLYYQSALVQPAPVLFTPAIYDFANNQNQILDILSLRETVILQIGRDINPTAFGFNSEKRLFFRGFAEVTGDSSFDGGIMVISEDGSLIEILELPFVPTYFIKN
ncbi:MAG: hypothetical protein ABF293_13730 [Flavobacteriaceae bacterium]